MGSIGLGQCDDNNSKMSVIEEMDGMEKIFISSQKHRFVFLGDIKYIGVIGTFINGAPYIKGFMAFCGVD